MKQAFKDMQINCIAVGPYKDKTVLKRLRFLQREITLVEKSLGRETSFIKKIPMWLKRGKYVKEVDAIAKRFE